MPDDTTPRLDDPARDAHLPMPGIQTAHDVEASEEHFLSSEADIEGNELHASGRVCARCGKEIRPGEDVRRTASGSFQHELCGLF
jgi:hypothetical protein